MDERRHHDRRQQFFAIRFPDRRRGFPRRTVSSTARRRYLGALAAVRRQPTVLVLLAALILALNLADLILTREALAAGAIEVNPVMAALFASSMSAAAAIKILVAAVVVGGLWALRRYRSGVAALIWVTAGMGVLVVYQVTLVAVIA